MKKIVIIFLISIILAITARLLRMEFVTASMLSEFIPLLTCIDVNLLEEITRNILFTATVKVILIDTLFNVFIVYLIPVVLKTGFRQEAIVICRNFMKYLTGDYR